MMNLNKISCDTCTGVCCKNITLKLCYEELAELLAGGTELYEYGTDDFLLIQDIKDTYTAKLKYALGPFFQKGETYYESYYMKGRCGYLSDAGRCTNYENRPQVCRDFSAGSETCKKIIKERT